ncbi:hypothetical protein PPL_09677 [Heterostelium album PN500]|uniref:Uncharacterized protein n=1 Tax=Heterostelium pallidum (strain ATCC 26659 / Pp 5 / PN500) TaxID=670386 RepID=D3BNH4_HETP5|nr:hypothetical protein PPL_09677 [Heterostelium album PN500]EFA76925.1 hypothetical protein PPL_09677 [Heterostelium album PN500]|eukprot:XP_020429057.1 hypothetical protein PPL_09677 [Heterostelium album PN500]
MDEDNNAQEGETDDENEIQQHLLENTLDDRGCSVWLDYSVILPNGTVIQDPSYVFDINVDLACAASTGPTPTPAPTTPALTTLQPLQHHLIHIVQQTTNNNRLCSSFGSTFLPRFNSTAAGASNNSGKLQYSHIGLAFLTFIVEIVH